MTSLSPALANILEHARDDELTASGTARRGAFRATRHLIAGLLDNGVHPVDIAVILNPATGSVRVRGGIDGTIPTDTVRRWLGDTDYTTLAATHTSIGTRDEIRGSELVRALLDS